MAWTDPRTWVTDELVTAAIMNTHIRDNLNSLNHLVVRKTADETKTSNTTLANDASLTMSIGANETWMFELSLLYLAGNGLIKTAFTVPAGATLSASTVWSSDSAAVARRFWLSSGDASSGTFGQAGAMVQVPPIRGVVVNGGTPGSLTLQWAQFTSDASATTVKVNSTLWAVRLA